MRCRFSTVASYLLLEHVGFQMVPVLDVYKATETDKEIEPGESLRRTDAVRIGKTLGAQWSVYGEVKNIHGYEKTGWFNTQKKTELTMRISIVNCESGDLIYWRTSTSTVGAVKQLGMQRPDKLIRRAILGASVDILQPFAQALPPHETVANIPDENADHVPDDVDILTVMNRLWPDDKDR